MNRILLVLFIAAIFLAIDFYVFTGTKPLFSGSAAKNFRYIYWSFFGLAVILLIVFQLVRYYNLNERINSIIATSLFITYISKFILVLFLALDDLLRLVRWAVTKISSSSEVATDISRQDFIVKTGIAVAAVPAVALTYGVVAGAHDYRLRHVKVPIVNLPSSFHGLRIGQLSDIHSGSFFNKKAVMGGVEMLLKAKPDLVCFTGDLVNNRAVEMKDYQPIFSKVKAPLGVYSTLGNHDYGDYVPWPSPQAKAQNIADLKQVHAQMGWQLMMNENKVFTQGGDELALVGIENWGAKARFPKYGKMNEALKGTEGAATKILLSHDPSHWDAQVRPKYQEIDLMLAGHTHGMQFGIETPWFKWSPVQYVYEQWAGLYQKDHQQLYVNRGFGFLGFPGRVGIWPEVTILELVKA